MARKVVNRQAKAAKQIAAEKLAAEVKTQESLQTQKPRKPLPMFVCV